MLSDSQELKHAYKTERGLRFRKNKSAKSHMAKVCERAHSLLVLGDCYFWLLSYQEGSWGQNHIYFGIFHKVSYNVSDP